MQRNRSSAAQLNTKSGFAQQRTNSLNPNIYPEWWGDDPNVLDEQQQMRRNPTCSTINGTKRTTSHAADMRGAKTIFEIADQSVQ